MMNVGERRNAAILEKLNNSEEPFFILRAQDALASALVLEWASRAEGAGVASDIVADARILSRQMRMWPKKKIPD